jgi:hypothetical protein
VRNGKVLNLKKKKFKYVYMMMAGGCVIDYQEEVKEMIDGVLGLVGN